VFLLPLFSPLLIGVTLEYSDPIRSKETNVTAQRRAESAKLACDSLHPNSFLVIDRSRVIDPARRGIPSPPLGVAGVVMK